MSAANNPSPRITESLVISADRLSLHEVKLPLMPTYRIRAALAGVLEEQLLDDPQDLHFALAPDALAAMKADQPFGVMVCNKAWLGAQCDQARRAGQSVSRIVPDLPQWQSAGWDLAQFDFKQRSDWAHRVQSAARSVLQDPVWRWARVGFLALLVIQLIGINLWAWHERSVLASKRAEIGKILMQAFPETTAVVDAPVQMQRGVALLRSKSAQLGDKDLESQLARAKPGAQQIDFAAGQIRTTP